MSLRPPRLLAVTAVLLGGLVGATAGPLRAEADAVLRREIIVPGGWFYWSSPVIADVNGAGGNDIVVGGLDRRVHAWDAARNSLPGFPAAATGAVASSPAVGDVTGDGRPEIVVGVGSLEQEVTNDQGAINVFDADGRRRCSLATNKGHEHTAVFNAPAIGDVTGDGVNDIVFGAFDHLIRVVDGNCNLLASFDNTDSIFSAPALYDVEGDGKAEIFIGGDATRGPAGQSHNGGYFRSLTYRAGHSAFGEFNLVQRWQRTSRETFQSAAAIGDIDGDKDLEVITGSGAYYCRHKSVCDDSGKLWAFDLDNGEDTPGWPKTTTYETTFLGSPALADLDGDGRTDVAVLTNQYNQASPNKEPNGGALDVFFGHGGRKTHVANSDMEIMTPPVIADIDGGRPEIVIGYSGHLTALNHNLEIVQAGIGPPTAHKSAAAVGNVGGWALVSTSFNPGNKAGMVHIYDIPPPASAPWPQFQMDPRRMGNDTYAPSAPKSPASPSVPVTAPPPPTTTTTKPKPKPAAPPTTKPPAMTTTAPPPPETTTTLAPETTTTIPPTTTTTVEDTTEPVGLPEPRSDGDGSGGTGPLPVVLGVVGLGSGGLFWRWRSLHRG